MKNFVIFIPLVLAILIPTVFAAPERFPGEGWDSATIVFTGIVLSYEDKGDERFYEFQVLEVEKSPDYIPGVIFVKSVTPEAYEPHDEDPVWGKKHVSRLYFFEPETEREFWQASYVSDLLTRHCNNPDHVVVQRAKVENPLICVSSNTAQKLSERNLLMDRFEPTSPILKIPDPRPNVAPGLPLETDFQDTIQSQFRYKIDEEQFGPFNYVVFSYSEDFGQTFSQPITMSQYEISSSEPKLIQADENVILAWRDEIGGNSLAFAVSKDHGKTFEKKYLAYGARPDLIYHNDLLYLVWINLDNHQVLYSTSKNLGMNFSEPIIVFMPTERFSPYTLAPTPIFSAEGQNIIINWKHSETNYHHVVGVDPQIPKLPQNDLECGTFWNATITADLDYNQLEKNIRNKIQLLPQMYSVPEREINVAKIDENKVQIIIQGCWGMSYGTGPDITNIIGEIEGMGDIAFFKDVLVLHHK